MSKSPSIVACTLALLVSAALAADPNDFIIWNGDLVGRLYVPPVASENPGTDYPLVVFLHGSGEGGTNNVDQVNSNIDNLLSHCKTLGWFLYAPQVTDSSPGVATWPDWEVVKVVDKVEDTLSSYNVDPQRVYVTGLSSGGGGTINALEVYRDVFAAGVAIAPGSGNRPLARAQALVAKPLWIYHAVNDGAISVNLSRTTVNCVRSADGKSSLSFPLDANPSNPYYNTGEPYYSDGSTFFSENGLQYTEYDTGGHAIWGRVYNEDWMYNWLDSKTLDDPGANAPPFLTIGDPVSIWTPDGTLNLDAVVVDDGQPDYPGTLYVGWDKLHGPGNVSFADDSDPATTVTFDAVGCYTLQLSVDDTDRLSTAERIVFVNSAAELATGVLPVYGANNTSGGSYCNLGLAFDAQPVWDDSTAVPIGPVGGGGNVPSTANKTGYIDLGPDYARLRITSTWTRYKAYTTGDQAAMASLWWDDDKDAVNDGVTVTEFNFNSAQDVQSSSEMLWICDADLSAAPITPAYRYLILATPATTTSRAVECAFIGHMVPEGQAPGNAPPSVDAGSDAAVTLPAAASLDATVSDDGLPDPPASVTLTWTQQSGPGTVTFADDSAEDTTATFSDAGEYVLRLTVDDGDLAVYDELTVTVSPAQQGLADIIMDNADATGVSSVGWWGISSSTAGYYATNYAHDNNVKAGKSFTFTPTITAEGTYEVYGRWTSFSNRATNVPFDITYAGGTDTVIVDQQADGGAWVLLGTYSFEEGTDGNVTIRGDGTNGYVIADAVRFLQVEQNTVPVADAGDNISIAWPQDSVVLDGACSDDGLPDPPAVLSVTWSKQSGPGTVTFDDANALDACATFSSPGSYVLRLTADDGELQAYDELTVMVLDDIIMDNADATGVSSVGWWGVSSSTAGYYGTDYRHDNNAAKGSKSFTYTPAIAVAGTYEVYARWTSFENRASNVPIDITDVLGTDTVTVDQRYDGGTWMLLGTYEFDQGSSGSVTIRNGGTDGYVIADAVRFLQTGP